MTLAQARAMARQFARNAQDPSIYTDADIDRAIQIVCHRFCRATHALRTRSSALTLTIASNVIPAVPTDFRPERLLRAWTTATDPYESVEVLPISYPALLDLRNDVGAGPTTGQPVSMAFYSQADGEVYPTPDAAYSLYFLYWQPFTTITPGTQGAYSASTTYRVGDVVSVSTTEYQCIQLATGQAPASSPLYWTSLGTATLDLPTATLNLPDVYLYEILANGVPAQLQRHEPEHAGYVQQAQSLYDAFERKMMGSGNLGAKVIQAMKQDDARPWPPLLRQA